MQEFLHKCKMVIIQGKGEVIRWRYGKSTAKINIWSPRIDREKKHTCSLLPGRSQWTPHLPLAWPAQAWNGKANTLRRLTHTHCHCTAPIYSSCKPEQKRQVHKNKTVNISSPKEVSFCPHSLLQTWRNLSRFSSQPLFCLLESTPNFIASTLVTRWGCEVPHLLSFSLWINCTFLLFPTSTSASTCPHHSLHLCSQTGICSWLTYFVNRTTILHHHGQNSNGTDTYGFLSHAINSQTLLYHSLCYSH